MAVLGAKSVLLLGVAVLTLSPRASLAQNFCDPVLKTDLNDPLAYKPREGRCEGLFVQQVSGGIQVASLHFMPRAFPSGLGKSVHLSWRLSRKLPSRLRAVSLNPKLFYRMDTLREPEANSYDWPTDLVHQLGLSSAEVGLLNWQNAEIAGRETQLFSPVSIEGGSSAIEIVLLPDLALEEIYLSLAPLDDGGKTGEYLFSDKALGYRIYPARRPVAIQFPSLEKSGVYRLEIGTLFKVGGSSSREVLFYNPGD